MTDGPSKRLSHSFQKNLLKMLDEDGFFAIEDGGLDCDDTDPLINPDGQEICNGVDDDRDGLVDGDDPSVDDPLLCQEDNDGMVIPFGLDCDDNDPLVNPECLE